MDSHPDTLIGSNIFDGLIRHDRLLTDSLNLGLGLLPPGQGLASEPPVVKTEHSYSMAGSDGDSIPDSPLSFTDTGKHNFNYYRRLLVILVWHLYLKNQSLYHKILLLQKLQSCAY